MAHGAANLACSCQTKPCTLPSMCCGSSGCERHRRTDHTSQHTIPVSVSMIRLVLLCWTAARYQSGKGIAAKTEVGIKSMTLSPRTPCWMPLDYAIWHKVDLMGQCSDVADSCRPYARASSHVFAHVRISIHVAFQASGNEIRWLVALAVGLPPAASGERVKSCIRVCARMLRGMRVCLHVSFQHHRKHVLQGC